MPRLRLDQLTVHENKLYKFDDEETFQEGAKRGSRSNSAGYSYDSDTGGYYNTSREPGGRRGRRTSTSGGSSSNMSETSDWESNNARPPRYPPSHSKTPTLGQNTMSRMHGGATPSLPQSRSAAVASRAAQRKLHEEDDKVMLDDPEVANRLRANQSGSWTGAGNGAEAAAATKVDRPVRTCLPASAEK